jgi:spermidine/putrescine transport system substrate-binding protein
MKKFFIRGGVILGWIILIFCALYWPKWKVIPYDKNTINIFAWGDILEPSIVSDFEKETGIKINLSYYSSNEELLVKIKATRGEGYDLIIPSDDAVHSLIKEELLKPINKEKLPFFDSINPNLRGHFYDPQNTYSIPFEWEIFGFGIDKEYFENRPFTSSWGLVFDPEFVHYKITMENDPMDATNFAAIYLYNSLSPLDGEKAETIRQLLMEQKRWVAAYANFRGDYFLATRNVAVVVASSSYILRTKKLFNFVDFVVPQEGTFITIENLCIPKPSEKEDLVYRFINYLYTPKSVAAHFETYSFFPATLQAIDSLNIDESTKKIIFSSPEDFKKYHFFKNLLPPKETRDLWVEIKTKSY